jgi:hypothetical protein
MKESLYYKAVQLETGNRIMRFCNQKAHDINNELNILLSQGTIAFIKNWVEIRELIKKCEYYLAVSGRIADEKYEEEGEEEVIKSENLFVDLLDGKWSLGYDNGIETRTLAVFEEDYETWLYPDELGVDFVINVFRDSLEDRFSFNVYSLPNNWREICVPTGNKSIHDVMKEVS